MDNDDSVPASVAAAGPAFRDAYLTLRRQYGAQLPAKLAQARDALDACLRQPGDMAALDRLRRLMHTMAGTAPSIGFEVQGAEARRVELLLQALAEQTDRTAADFASVKTALAQLDALGTRR